MLVVVDANIIMKDAILRDRKWEVARAAIEAGRLRLVLPEVARLEALAGYRRDHEEKIRQIKSVIRKSTSRAKDAAAPLIAVYEAEIESYEPLLNDRLREVGFEIADPPDHEHLELTKRAVSRRPPFDGSGGGYRDTLVWLTAIDQIAEHPFDNLTFVSDDGIFTKGRQNLSDELRREANAELIIERSIVSVEFPGEYESGQFDLSSLDIDTHQIVRRIQRNLAGSDISRWSPPGVDHAQVEHVDHVELLTQTVGVRRRYGSDVYEVDVEAIADIDAQVLIIHDGYGDEVDFSQMSARWDLHVRWRGETEGELTRLSGDGTIEVLGLQERRRSER